MAEPKRYLDLDGTKHLADKIKQDYEKIGNKVNSITSSSPTNYPSEGAVKDYVERWHDETKQNKDTLDTDVATHGYIKNTYHDSTKQDKLTAGQNITISDDNVISATGGGSDVQIVEFNLDYPDENINKLKQIFPGVDLQIDGVAKRYDDYLDIPINDANMSLLQGNNTLLKINTNTSGYDSEKEKRIFLRKLDTASDCVYVAQNDLYVWVFAVDYINKKGAFHRYRRGAIQHTSKNNTITITSENEAVNFELESSLKVEVDKISGIESDTNQLKEKVSKVILTEPTGLDPEEIYEFTAVIVNGELEYHYTPKSWDGMRIEDESLLSAELVKAKYGGPLEDWHLLSDEYDVYQWLRHHEQEEE